MGAFADQSIHVWAVDLRQPADVTSELELVLSHAEREDVARRVRRMGHGSSERRPELRGSGSPTSRPSRGLPRRSRRTIRARPWSRTSGVPGAAHAPTALARGERRSRRGRQGQVEPDLREDALEVRVDEEVVAGEDRAAEGPGRDVAPRVDGAR